MEGELSRIVGERLKASGFPDEEALLVIASVLGGEPELESMLSGKEAAPPKAMEAQPDQPVGAFLGALTVEGFRGIGGPASLDLLPGPGLTLVVGRNGSGKSSFAEALEILFTGDNRRWRDRSAIWQDGWRNLHHGHPTSVTVQLAVEGRAGATKVSRAWDARAGLDGGAASVQPHAGAKADLDSLGWSNALVAYRPFLSYNELGSMLDEGPSKLYDALSAVLGLDDLVDAEKALGDARRKREKAVKDVQASLKPLTALLESSADERAGRCLSLLKAKPWDLDAIEDIVLGGDSTSAAEGDLSVLRQLCTLEGPALDEVLGSLVS